MYGYLFFFVNIADHLDMSVSGKAIKVDKVILIVLYYKRTVMEYDLRCHPITSLH